MIFREVLETVGFDDLNATIKDQMRQWIINSALASENDVRADSTPTCLASQLTCDVWRVILAPIC